MIPRLHLLTRGLRKFLSRQRALFSSEGPVPSSTTSSGVSPPGETDPPAEVATSGVVVERKERVVNLDPPQDLRTPLPGNVGFSLFTDIIKLSELPDFVKVIDLLKDHNSRTMSPPEQYHVNNMVNTISYYDPMEICSEMTECKIFSCPELVKADFRQLFPHRLVGKDSPFTVLVVSLRTTSDMGSWSCFMEMERMELGSKFVGAAEGVCQSLVDMGYWAEYVDPSTGLVNSWPENVDIKRRKVSNYEGSLPAKLLETDHLYRHFGLEVVDLGCCKVVNHPRWKSHTLVGSLFTSAPPAALRPLALEYYCPPSH